MGLYERKSAVWDGFERGCSRATITSQNIYGHSLSNEAFLKSAVTLYSEKMSKLRIKYLQDLIEIETVDKYITEAALLKALIKEKAQAKLEFAVRMGSTPKAEANNKNPAKKTKQDSDQSRDGVIPTKNAFTGLAIDEPKIITDKTAQVADLSPKITPVMLRNKARKMYQYTRHPSNKTILNRLQHKILTSLDTDDGSLWGFARSFRKKRSPIPALKGHTTIAYSDTEKAETLADSLENHNLN
ncbi:hypothetical protein TNCV_4359791 [Trichonephila clavipes]|uniref:Uncharacterized protein n=1 Tax=Trichonephila clavipes TaxID=2585209 RepID=A0A8X6W9W3_TRICX|nr:hypothetical protein TNCV_4359791 [Trichonephila clavipes]